MRDGTKPFQSCRRQMLDALGRTAMNTKPWLCGAIVLAAAWTAPTYVRSATLAVDCDSGDKIQDKLAQAKADDVVQVSGACKDGVQVPSDMVRVTLDGQGKARIE